ncbi:MAG: hypothetical protein ACRC17_03570 [Culicoidibacterales bacterium]
MKIYIITTIIDEIEMMRTKVKKECCTVVHTHIDKLPKHFKSVIYSSKKRAEKDCKALNENSATVGLTGWNYIVREFELKE